MTYNPPVDPVHTVYHLVVIIWRLQSDFGQKSLKTELLSSQKIIDIDFASSALPIQPQTEEILPQNCFF